MSFETNMKTDDFYTSEIVKVIKAFKPQSFDIITFSPASNIALPELKNYILKDVYYGRRSTETESFSC